MRVQTSRSIALAFERLMLRLYNQYTVFNVDIIAAGVGIPLRFIIPPSAIVARIGIIVMPYCSIESICGKFVMLS